MARYTALAQSESPDAVLIITPDGKVLHWDAGAEALFGFTGDDAIGRSIFDLIVPSDQHQEEAQLLASTLSDGRGTFESLRHRKDGSQLYVCITNKAITDPASGEPLILSTKKDVTELRVRRDAQRVESKFRDLLESVPDAVVIVNPTGHIVYSNEHARRIFDYSAGELPGKSIETLLPERFRRSHLGHRVGYFTRPLLRSMDIGLDLYGMRKDGSEFPVEISLSPLQVEDTTLAMSAIRDISDRKQIENELRDKNVALVNANRAKNQFLASMSHELRTPLNSIIGFTGTLLMRMPGELNDEQEKQLRIVQGSARHLLSLINDLLDLATIEAERLELVREAIDFGELLEEVCGGLRPQADAKGLEFTISVPDVALRIKSDRRALSQIVINLVENAIKFTDSGFVRASLRRPGVGNGSAEVHVEDSGPGIRAEDLVRAFDPFTRFEQGNRKFKSGTGLGLHLSQKLAVQLGGSIACESVVGRGSTFVLRLKD
jgi:PAS domain S-box-containing protein